MLVIHANWSAGRLALWAESIERFAQRPDSVDADGSGGHSSGKPNGQSQRPMAHPFTASSSALAGALAEVRIETSISSGPLRLKLPSDLLGPWPSSRLSSVVGADEHASDPTLGEYIVETVDVSPSAAPGVLRTLAGRRGDDGIEAGHSVRFWSATARFTLDLLMDQRFLPTLLQVDRQHLAARWTPWLHDDEVVHRFTLLSESMPPVARANGGDGRALIESAMEDMTDGLVRDLLVDEEFVDALDGRDPADDAHVAWLAAVLGRQVDVPGDPDRLLSLFTDARRWLSRLCDTGEDLAWHLLLELTEPDAHTRDWHLRLALQSAADPSREVSAYEVWAQAGSEGGGDDRLPELLLAELDRAASLYPRLEEALGEATPPGIALSTADAHRLLVEYAPLLEESGFRVVVPSWWGSEQGRLSAQLHVDAPPIDAMTGLRSEGGVAATSLVGLNAIVDCRWRIAIGDEVLNEEELSALLEGGDPLVQVRGRWVHLHAEVVEQARALLRDDHERMKLVDALRLAHGDGAADHGLELGGLTATGWVGELLGSTEKDASLPEIEQPDGFIGTLRPYQVTGLQWLSFLSKFGVGSCLADDMGLGKTIQLIALLLHEREELGSSPGPTLLVVPTSVVANWERELARFGPSVRTMVHHGADRAIDERFEQLASETDIVITTYGLVHRDRESLDRVEWFRVALDEAQYIKNPPTKQAQAIRALRAWHRVALTGTPVENRLSELWSIMEFLNPGFLGPSASFRRLFARPIEQRRDVRCSERLRGLVQPFILRRVKTDSTVIDDLPECLQTREYATLTKEQATLYEKVVANMLGEVDRSSGIQRRGLVLATLVKLKQICNHPSHYAQAKHHDSVAPLEAEVGVQSSRSGKARRMLTLLEEVVATGERALVFTQFREMGRLLSAMIQHDLGCETLFLHGGTSPRRRQQFIDQFQSEEGTAPIFVLSLKAGGVGLNLTAANHVFHFDRWWNPAVENQATDRAFRIGQTRTVHVHKFVCVGTLEERIDQMIEQKTDLAQNIIGTGEQWLSELTTGQLRDVLKLRDSALEIDQ